MSTTLVVDASVAIKWYLPEIHADAAIGCLDLNYTLLVPDLFFAEFGNILWKKFRIGELKESEARSILDALVKVPLQNYSAENFLLPAYELAIVLDRTVYDCIYQALAISEGCRMLTADRKFYEAVMASPYSVNVQWVEDFVKK